MGNWGGGRVRKLSVVCLHNNAIVARGILVTKLHCGTPKPPFSAIYIVSSVGTSLLSKTLFTCVAESWTISLHRLWTIAGQKSSVKHFSLLTWCLLLLSRLNVFLDSWTLMFSKPRTPYMPIVLMLICPLLNRRNPISAMLADLQCIEGEVPGYCPPNCAIIMRADPGTCDILPTMHWESANMADIWFRLLDVSSTTIAWSGKHFNANRCHEYGKANETP